MGASCTAQRRSSIVPSVAITRFGSLAPDRSSKAKAAAAAAAAASAAPSKPTTGSATTASVPATSTSDFTDLATANWQSPSHAEKPVGIRWRRGDKIGQGAYGVVYMGLDEIRGRLMAVKEIPLSSFQSQDPRLLQREIDLLRRCVHRNIVQYIAAEVTGDSLLVFTEWVPGGSLSQVITEFGGLSESLVRIYSRQVLEGLVYLHSNNVVHRDIKPANILVDNNGVLKLADFGASILGKPVAGGPTIHGTPYYMAPEVVQLKGHDKAADIWSVGCTVIHLISGIPPWKQLALTDVHVLMSKIATCGTPPPFPPNLSAPLTDFLNLCFAQDPAQRSTAAMLLNHPFLAETMSTTSSEEMESDDEIPAKPLHAAHPASAAELLPTPEQPRRVIHRSRSHDHDHASAKKKKPGLAIVVTEMPTMPTLLSATTPHGDEDAEELMYGSDSDANDLDGLVYGTPRHGLEATPGRLARATSVGSR